mgnify:CR=1 FL=1
MPADWIRRFMAGSSRTRHPEGMHACQIRTGTLATL